MELSSEGFIRTGLKSDICQVRLEFDLTLAGSNIQCTFFLQIVCYSGIKQFIF